MSDIPLGEPFKLIWNRVGGQVESQVGRQVASQVEGQVSIPVWVRVWVPVESRAWGQVEHKLVKGRAFMVLFSTNAAPSANEVPGQVTPLSLVRKLFNLVFKARWDRAFTAIR